MSKTRDILAKLQDPVHPATLGLLRIVFGIVMLHEFRKLRPYVVDQLSHAPFTLTYDFFHWIPNVGPDAMSLVFDVGTVAAIALTVGAATRVAALVAFTCFTYVFLLDRGHYNNHFYLFSLFGFWLSVVDCGKWCSLDRLVGRVREPRDAVPRWQLLVFQWHIWIVYFYGGLAKLNPDWLAGFPMKIWLPQRAYYAWVGPFLATDAAAYLMSYLGIAFDILVGFALFSRRWRWWALLPIAVFNLSNHFLWTIGAFPWFMLAATGLFFDPDWPQRLWSRVTGQSTVPAAAPSGHSTHPSAVLITSLTLYFAVQLLLPFRHLLYPGDPAWHGQGSLFAWRMMLHDRFDAVRIRVAVPGKGTIGYIELSEYVLPRQFQKMGWQPKTFHRLALFLAEEMSRNAGIEDASIYVQALKSVNGRPYQPLIDPNVDLAHEPYPLLTMPRYILPLDPTLKPHAGKGDVPEPLR